MKKLILTALTLFLMAFITTSASSYQVELWDYYFNVNGAEYFYGDSVPGMDDSAFDWDTGIGTLALTFNPGAGEEYYISGMFDHEMYDDNWDGAYNDENTEILGAADPTYLQWGYNESPDAFMEIGYGDFDLAADEYAVISFILGEADPGGFRIRHWDESNDGQIFLSSTISIVSGQEPVPEPATILLLGIGLLGITGIGRKSAK